MSLVARHLEANGIPTMCLASALDIIEAGNPPRATFVDYPFGHTVGKPFDRADQLSIARAALTGLETMTTPGGIERLSNRWSNDDAWKVEAGSGTGDDAREPRSALPQFEREADRAAAIATGALLPSG